MSARKLFDDEVELSGGPCRETESTFQYLNRAKGPVWQRVRDLAEQWYADYPDETGDLRSRFRRNDPHQHVPAWWELYTYTLFCLLGYLVEVHPRHPNSDKRPDFLVTRDSGRMYVECAVLFEDDADDNTDGQMWIRDCINQAKNPNFMVDVEMHVRGTQRPRVLDITQPIEEWLTSLDADAVAADIAAGAESPTFELSVRGWVIGLSAWPVLPERRGEADRLIGAYFPFGGVRMLDDIVRIRTILRKKGSQYGPLDAPLVVALLSWSTFAGKRDMTNAALGSIGVSYVPGDVRSAQPVRRRNGYWRPPPELRGTRISGVLFGEHHLGLWSPASVLPGLWVNPWAETRLEVSLPFATFTADDRGEILSEDASVTPRDVFGLPPYWPNDPE